MEEGRRAKRASNRDKKEGTWKEASRHVNQHKQPSINVLESKAVEEGRRAEHASNGDEKEGI